MSLELGLRKSFGGVCLGAARLATIERRFAQRKYVFNYLIYASPEY